MRRTCYDQSLPAFMVMVLASESKGWVWMDLAVYVWVWWDQVSEGKNCLAFTCNTSSGIRKKMGKSQTVKQVGKFSGIKV